jgi:type III pantothenate kinase
MDTASHLLTLAVGNSRARIGLFRGEELSGSQSFQTGDTDGLVAWIASNAGSGSGLPLLVATVNPSGSDRLVEACRELGVVGTVLRIGRDVPIPMVADVREPDRVGQDRLLCALAAWVSTEGPCVVVDCGTATTVDFVSEEGVFRGGAIAPGVAMMLDSMHKGTAALPRVAFDPSRIDAEPVGKDTETAMHVGVGESIRGLVWRLVERYAEVAGMYPRVVATGGDSGSLFGTDSIVEHVVPDLQLIGMRLAFQALMQDDDDEDDRGEG